MVQGCEGKYGSVNKVVDACALVDKIYFKGQVTIDKLF